MSNILCSCQRRLARATSLQGMAIPHQPTWAKYATLRYSCGWWESGRNGSEMVFCTSTVLPLLRRQHLGNGTRLACVPFLQTTSAVTNSQQVQMLTCSDKGKEQSFFTGLMHTTFFFPQQSILLHQSTKEHIGKKWKWFILKFLSENLSAPPSF